MKAVGIFPTWASTPCTVRGLIVIMIPVLMMLENGMHLPQA